MWKLLKSPRERALFSVVLILLVLLAGTIAGVRLMERQAFLRKERFRLRSEALELRSWIEDGPAIVARRQWLDEHLPELSDARSAGLDFLQSIEDTAAGVELELTAKSILDPEMVSRWTGVPVRVTARGEFSKVVRLLHELQRPGDFVMVRELILKGGRDTSEVTSEIEFFRVFRRTEAGGEAS